MNAGGNHHDQAHGGLSCRGEKALERLLQHEERQRDCQDAAVDDGLVKQAALGTHERAYGADAHERDRAAQHAGGDDGVDDEREQAPCARLLALAQRLGHERRATRAEHEAQRTHHRKERVDEIERGERLLAHEV